MRLSMVMMHGFDDSSSLSDSSSGELLITHWTAAQHQKLLRTLL
jgi:hypothetical protein